MLDVAFATTSNASLVVKFLAVSFFKQLFHEKSMAIRLSGHLLETFFETCQAQEGEQRQSTTNLVQQKIPGVGRRRRRRRGGRPLHPCRQKMAAWLARVARLARRRFRRLVPRQQRPLGLGVHLIKVDRWRPGCLPRVSSRWCEKNARQLRVLWSWFFFIIVAADYADNTWSPNLIRVPPEAQSVERKLICHVWTRSPHTLLMGRWYLRRRSQWHWVGYIGAVSWHNGQWSMIEGGLVVINVCRRSGFKSGPPGRRRRLSKQSFSHPVSKEIWPPQSPGQRRQLSRLDLINQVAASLLDKGVWVQLTLRWSRTVFGQPVKASSLDFSEFRIRNSIGFASKFAHLQFSLFSLLLCLPKKNRLARKVWNFDSVVFRQYLAPVPSSTVIKETVKKEEGSDNLPFEKWQQLSSESWSPDETEEHVQNMSTKGVQVKWSYLKSCSPFKNQARTLARKLEKELIRRGVTW